VQPPPKFWSGKGVNSTDCDCSFTIHCRSSRGGGAAGRASRGGLDARSTRPRGTMSPPHDASAKLTASKAA
jgi:hypothetical protein